jgi:hypothetical protein
MSTKKAKNPCKSRQERPLTLPQSRAIALILEGCNDSEVARKCSVHRGTLSDWRRHNAGFQAELARCSHELLDGAMERLQGLVPLAVDALRSELQSDGPGRLQAALFLVRRWDGIQASLPPAEKSGEEEKRQPGEGLISLLGRALNDEDKRHMREAFERRKILPGTKMPAMIAEDGPSDEEIASPCPELPMVNEVEEAPVIDGEDDEEKELSEVEEVEGPEIPEVVTSCASCSERTTCRRASPEDCPRISVPRGERREAFPLKGNIP